MKKITTVMLLVGFLCLQVTAAVAKPVEVENEVLVVAEDELVELTAQEKFTDLMVIMKELVQQKIESGEELKRDDIIIDDFELEPEQGFKIYYYIAD